MRLSLKGHSFSTFTAASAMDIDDMWKRILQIDSTVTQSENVHRRYNWRKKRHIKSF